MTDIIKKTGGNTAAVLINRTIGNGPGEISATQFKQEFAELNPDTELNVFFDSNGGGVSDTKEIYRTLRGHRGPTNAQAQGLCASSASVLALACDSITMSSDALFMIHLPHWSTSRSEAMCSVGNQKMITIPRGFNKQMPITIPTMATDKNASVRRTLEDNRRTIKKHRDLLNDRKVLLSNSTEFILDVYHARTGAIRSDLAEMMQAETWFSANDALTFGFADFITAPTGLVDHVDFTQFSNPTNFLAGKYMDSAGSARGKRSNKVARKKVAYTQQQAHKIIQQRNEA